MNFEIARSSAWEFRNHRNLLSPEFSDRVESGLRISQDTYASAQRLATECRQLAHREFADVDLWMTLSAPGEAPTGLSSTGLSTFNKLWTLLKLPCVHLPVGKGRNGLPLGIQLIAWRDADLQLLADACLVEEALRDSLNIEDPAQ
jgi:Asp-tRNA(Asn)/Glu-tRNA(Gln) amidotransferase A subunit family amidase